MSNQVVLLRVGVDTGCGGIQGPLFEDGSFEFVCIPDNHRVSAHTYGNMLGRDCKPLTGYFAESRRAVSPHYLLTSSLGFEFGLPAFGAAGGSTEGAVPPARAKGREGDIYPQVRSQSLARRLRIKTSEGKSRVRPDARSANRPR